jgi:hypothetical protein
VKDNALNDGCRLRQEETVSHILHYDIKNSEIGLKKDCEWNISPDI